MINGVEDIDGRARLWLDDIKVGSMFRSLDHLVEQTRSSNSLDDSTRNRAWPTPTQPGDLLHVELTVIEMTRSRSKSDRGFVICTYLTVNQHGHIRQRATANLSPSHDRTTRHDGRRCNHHHDQTEARAPTPSVSKPSPCSSRRIWRALESGVRNHR